MQLVSRVVTASEPGPHLLITAGVHGDEFAPMAAVRRLIQFFSPGGAADGAAGESSAGRSSRLLRGKLTLTPVVNEAAFLRGSRVAEDGLDLARTCPGRAHGTVTERTASAVSELIRSADYYIDLHTGGSEMSVLPMIGYILHPDMKIIERQRAMAQAFNLPVIWGTAANLHGRTLSVARDAGIPALYAEYLGANVYSPQGAADYFDGCLNVMRMLEMAEGAPPAPRVEHLIEDHRPGSGHMQVCHPAPRTGFFEPAVRLGERVEEGQRLGTVCDLLGEERDEVLVERSGIVLVLRTFARVIANDSLGVVAASSEAASTDASPSGTSPSGTSPSGPSPSGPSPSGTSS